VRERSIKRATGTASGIATATNDIQRPTAATWRYRKGGGCKIAGPPHAAGSLNPGRLEKPGGPDWKNENRIIGETREKKSRSNAERDEKKRRAAQVIPGEMG